jgi:2-phospho-L-lactate guanylyltransferase (CobY/MobA/RfbA family)
VLFKKNLTIKERAAAALAGLQRNAYAMSMLRSRLESRVNFILNQQNGVKSGSYHELAKVLELVKNGEMILNDMSEKIEAARFLEEFIIIIDGAAASISEIKTDIQQLVPMAEMALQEMHDAIARVSVGMSKELRQEIEPAIFAEVSAAIAIEKEKDTLVTASSANVEDLQSKGIASRASEEKEEESEDVAI